MAHAGSANTQAAAAQAQAAQHAAPGGAQAHEHQNTPMRNNKAHHKDGSTQGMAAGQGWQRHTWHGATTTATHGHNTWHKTATATAHGHTNPPKYMNKTHTTSKPAKRLFGFTHKTHHTITHTYTSRYSNIVL